MLNSEITKPIQDIPTDEPVHVSRRVSPALWKLQAYGLMTITFTSFFPKLIHYQEYLFFVLLAVTLCLALVEKINPWIRTPVDLPLLGFVAWVLCTIPFATDVAYSFSEWRKLAAQVLVFYWAVFVLQHHRQGDLSRQIVWAVVIGSLTLSCFSLVDFVLRGGTWQDRVVRAVAPYSDFQWLTTYLVLVIPILIGWVVTNRTAWVRALGILSLVLTGLTQVVAYTRAGWVAHFVEAVGFGLMTGRRRFVTWIIAGVIAIAGGMLLASQLGYQRSTTDPWTLSARVKAWELGFHQVAQSPLVGVGYGNNTFLKIYKAEIEADKDKDEKERLLPALHSSFAMVLMGSGVPAIILYVWIFVSIVATLARQWWLSRVAETQWLLMAVAVVTLGFVTRNLFDYMFAGSLAHLFWILVAVGLCSVKPRNTAETGDFSLNKTVRCEY